MTISRRHRDRLRAIDPLVAAARAQRAHLFAVLGTLLAASSFVFIAHGYYRSVQIVGEMDFRGNSDVSAIVDSITRTTTRLHEAGTPLAIGGAVLLIGACLITHALHWGRFRRQWFFWSTLGLAFVVFFLPPLGSLFSIAWSWCLLWYRSEFFSLKAIPVPN